METNELITRIQAIASPEDMAEVDALIRAIPGPMHADVQRTLLEKLSETTAQAKAARNETVAIFRQHGVDYPLSDWLTPANYARKFGLKNAMVVTNWMARGVIPAENIKDIPELGLRLVKAVPYSPRPYATSGAEKDAA